jgi:hypothetical protein
MVKIFSMNFFIFLEFLFSKTINFILKKEFLKSINLSKNYQNINFFFFLEFLFSKTINFILI